MKTVILIISGICLTILVSGQTVESSKLIELGKYYVKYYSGNLPTEKVFADINQNIPENLKKTTSFIVQTITTDNSLLTKEFLSLPDEQTIKYIYIITLAFIKNMGSNHIDDIKLIDSLKNKFFPHLELVDNYYRVLFTGAGNKIKPFNLNSIDFKLQEYNLTVVSEKGIFFLRAMESCGKQIWGFMNLLKPADTKKAYEYIKKFPKFCSQEYYKYCDFNFPDIEMLIRNGKEPQSYKGYFIDEYYDVLLTHFHCMEREADKEEKKNDLFSSSILKDTTLFKFSRQYETLAEIFKNYYKK